MRICALKASLTFFILFTFHAVFSQQFHIQSPVDFPIFLSGNFGELRSTHFHAGIDIKTYGEVGKKIRSIEKGYVSRVRIQAGGYGHAVYITHPNGYTSVYGHLNEFYPELEAFTKKHQYAKKSFEVDIYPEKDQFIVSRGQFIGLSGNTGRSGGPHLHLEIRDENQVPLNGLKFGLPIADSTRPVFKNLAVYNNINGNTFETKQKMILPVTLKNGVFRPAGSVEYTGNIAFGVEVYDFLDGSANQCGVYQLQLFIDNELLFESTIDKISYNETSYIRSYCDYGEKLYSGKSIHRLFIEPNNRLSVYTPLFANGLYSSDTNKVADVNIVAIDVYGNKSVLAFKLIKSAAEPSSVPFDSSLTFVNYKTAFTFENEIYRFHIPSDALFSNKFVSCRIQASAKDYLSDFFMVGNELTPVNKYPKLSLKIPELSKNFDVQKMLVVRVDTTGKKISEGGRFESGWIVANVNGFGKYAIAIDTVKPVIEPVSFRTNSWYTTNDILSFRISDELSGIKTYNGYINEKWVLFEYDEKTKTLFYKIDSERLTRSKTAHELKLFVMDERNNVQNFSGKFYY